MQNANEKTASALVVVDLGAGGHLVPILLAGAGLDSADAGYNSVSAHHLEAGLGLEYRADGGLIVGADARLGDRTIDSQTTFPDLFWNPLFQGGQYRSARVTLGVRF